MAFKELIQLTIKAGKFIGNAKAVKNVTDFASTNWKEKQRQKQAAQKKQKEREDRRKTIKNIQNRNIFETIAIYIIGTAAACYIASFGWLQAVIVAFIYFTHMSSIYELSGSVDLRREWMLTIISLICTVITCLRHL